MSDFNEIRISSTDFRKNSQIPNVIKICPVSVEAEFFHADRRTETTKLIVVFFSQF
jgi:hypothetical protein